MKIKFKILDDNKIEYIVKSTRGAQLKLRIRQNSPISILVPISLIAKGIEYDQINKFIIDNIDWIIKNYQKKQNDKPKFSTGSPFMYLGKKYKLDIHISKYPTVIETEDILHVYAKNFDDENIKAVIDNWLDEKINLVYNEILFKLFSQMKSYLKSYPKLEIKSYKSRWGTCYFKRNLIIINKKLIHTEIDCIEYVICHELCHFVYQSHNEDFHNLVNKYVNEKYCNNLLKKYKVTDY